MTTVEEVQLFKNNGSPDSTTKTEVSTEYGSVLDETTKTTTVKPVEVGENTSGGSTASSTSVTIPIGQESSPNEETGLENHVDSKSFNLIKARSKKMSNFRVTKKEIEESKALLERQAKELGIDMSELPQEEKDLYMALAIAYKKGHISEAEFIKIVEEYGSDEVVKAVKNLIPEGTQEVDEKRMNKLRSHIKRFGKLHSMVSMQIAENQFGATPEETQKLREKSLMKSAERSEQYSEELMEKVKDAIPENCSEDVAKAAIDTVDEYAKAKIDGIKTLAKNRNYSPEFLSKLTQMEHEILKRIQIRKYKIIRYLNKKIKVKEHILDVRKEVAERKLEEKEEAKVFAQKTKAKVKYWMEQAAKTLWWDGLDKLTKENKEKVIRKKEPKLAIEIDFARRHDKWAKEAEEDATFASKQAERAVESMEISLAYTKLQKALIESSIG